MPKPPRSLARHEAWIEFAKRAEIGHFAAPIRMIMEAAFNAGWAARKAAQYAAIGQLPKPRKLVENREHALMHDDPDKFYDPNRT